MSSSLIPERPLLISPTLAATIGLEEAVMLHVISELILQHTAIWHKQRRWIELPNTTLENSLPFWNATDITRIRHNLQAKGLLLVESSKQRTDTLVLAINQPQTPDQTAEQAATTPRSPEQLYQPAESQHSSAGRATYIAPNWEPDDILYSQCQQQYGIPRSFIEQRVKTFVMYQRERQNTNYSWHNAFLKWIIREWRQAESYKGAKELESNMSADWRPSEDAVDILHKAGIATAFIEDSIPEFVLYWRERGLVTSTWNTKFIAHVRRQWAKYNVAIQHDNTPSLISDDFEPSAACYEVLAMANIDLDFARAQLHEFILYWQDRKEACASWNTRFLQHVKYKWASRHHAGLPVEQQLETTLSRMADRSWAD